MKRRALVALATASALVLTACGGDDEPEATDEATPTEDMATEDMATEDMATEEATEAAGMDLPDPIVLTLTPSQDTTGLIETAEPLGELLSAELGVAVEARVPTDYAGVIAALESGQAQIAGGLGPRQMVQAEEQAGAQMILQSERFGSFTYVTQWFTNDPDTFCDDEPVEVEQDEGEPYLFCNGVDQAETAEDGPIGQDKLAEVEGLSVSFVDQGSTSGYAVPALQLFEAGVDPIDGVESTFAGGHDNSVLNVYNGDAVVGVSYNDGSLSDEAVQAITDALLSISETEEGAALMSELYNIDALAPVDSAAFDDIRTLEEELGDVLG
jgi:phosphonate transport system substrate-binding protein